MLLGSAAGALAVLVCARNWVVSAATVGVRGYDDGHWNLYEHLGNLAPYHKAPVPAGIDEVLPEDCTVDQIMLMGRHGSRYPLPSDLSYIQNLTYKLGNASEVIQKANLPTELQFLKKGYTTTLGHDDLTAPGRKQLFEHGVDFRLKYPDLVVTSVLAGDSDRVIESAQWFAQGYFGRTWPELNKTMFSIIPEDNVTVSWITASLTCPKWTFNSATDPVAEWDAIYLPPITKRLNELLPGINFTDADVHGALYACPYDFAAHGVSPWCGFFTETEIRNFEYELDLLMNGGWGYGLPGSMGPVLGSLYVNKLIERFTNSTGNASTVYLEFGHDTTLESALTGLGLAKDVPSLSATGPVNPNRKWRTSNQVEFGAQMIWERFSCESSFTGPQIRLVLNDSPFPLTICSDMSEKYGSCSLDDFVKANAYSQNITWGDATWNAACGASNF